MTGAVYLLKSCFERLKKDEGRDNAMDKINEYINRAKDLAEDAGGVAKTVADDIVGKAKELTEEGSTARDLVMNAKERTSSAAAGAREKVEAMFQDARAVKEIRQGIAELEALPEVEGSIIYKMELETIINNLNSLVLTIEDNRLDDASVAEEISGVMDKVKPDAELPAEDSAEQQAINSAKTIAYNACKRALETLSVEK